MGVKLVEEVVVWIKEWWMSRKSKRSRVRKLGNRGSCHLSSRLTKCHIASIHWRSAAAAGRELRWLVLSVKGAAFLIWLGAVPHKNVGAPGRHRQGTLSILSTNNFLSSNNTSQELVTVLHL